MKSKIYYVYYLNNIKSSNKIVPALCYCIIKAKTRIGARYRFRKNHHKVRIIIILSKDYGIK